MILSKVSKLHYAENFDISKFRVSKIKPYFTQDFMCVLYVELQCGTPIHMFIHVAFPLADTQEIEGTYLQQPKVRRILVPELPSNHVYCLYHMESL